MSEWYYANNSQSCGPFSEEDFKKLIKGGMVNPDTYVWNSEPGNAERGWVRAADTELNTFFNRKSPPPPPPTDVRAQKPDSTDYTYNGGQRQQKNAEIFPNVMHELGAKLGAKLENFFKLAEPPSTESPLDVKVQKPDSTDYIHNDGQRQQEYTGTVYKCSNCGEALQSFVTHCPTCGFELRGAKATNTVRELAAKLEEIESRGVYERQKLSEKYSESLENSNKLYAIEREIEREYEKRKISLISTFAIPNTKEDILEFLILASSSVIPGNINDGLTQAWWTKFEQAYQKAKLVFGNSSDFQNIYDIYEKTNKEIENKKKSERIIVISLAAFFILLLLIGAIVEILTK